MYRSFVLQDGLDYSPHPPAGVGVFQWQPAGAMAVLRYAHCTGAQVVNAPQGERAPIIKITSATIPWVLAPAISQRWWGSSPLVKGRLGELIWIVGPCIAPPHVRHIPESRPAMSLISSLISLNLEDREHTICKKGYYHLHRLLYVLKRSLRPVKGGGPMSCQS